MSESGAAIELPKYKCHKEVHALKIRKIVSNPNDSADIFFENDRYQPVNVHAVVAARFRQSEDDLGYYVVYEDGYVSWSPTKAFEDGYSRID